MRELADVLSSDDAPRVTSMPATVVRVDREDVAWVRLPGAVSDTPVARRYADVAAGDAVEVRVEGGRLVIVGNSTSPAVGSAAVEGAVAPVRQTAESARAAAEGAEAYAARAYESADSAARAASVAQASAESAQTSANFAYAEAIAAHSAANDAQDSADTAAGAASAAQTSANFAYAEAIAAHSAANDAQDSAADARSRADAAQTSANEANAYANASLDQLSVVDDVIGVLAWASQHGSFVTTQDSSIVDGKVYFTYDESTGDYLPVVQPTASELSTYFEMTVDEAMQEFILSHMAVTSRGLWLLPNGINAGSVTPAGGESTADARARLGTNYKVLLANDGLYVYDGDGLLVSTFGENVSFSSTRRQYIGNETSYILFTPATQSAGARLVISGSVEVGTGMTLSELIGDVARASSDAASAVQAANDVPIVTLSSTNGTVFKRNVGVSTTIVATIFTPGGRIDDSAELRRRFGAGAYLQWGWRDVVTDADHVLPSTDPRIVMDGFGLLVSPGDIDTQAVITCSLIC